MKDVSEQHAANLVTLADQVASYRTAIAVYYQGLELEQREAYVAQMSSRDLDRASLGQLDAPSGKASLPDSAAKDFIDVGVRLADQRRFWANHFDFWVSELGGDSLEAKRASLEQKIDALRQTPASSPPRKASLLARALEALRQAAQETDEDLTYASIAIDLRQQHANLDRQLDLLSKQVEVMQAFHGVVNEYLSIDATIDGKKIAEAAQAGAAVDSALLGDVTQPVRGHR